MKKNMNNAANNITELVFLLDRSGSMAGLESDTIGGFNGMITKQKDGEGEVFVSTVLFDHETEVLHDRVPIAEIALLTDRDYTVRGCTALLDAVGKSILHIRNIHKYARPEDVPAHTMFVITTDGLENASKEFTHAKLKKMIEAQQELGWEFLFIGANIDAIGEAAKVGIRADRAVNYHSDSAGTHAVFRALAEPIRAMRQNRAVESSWCEEIEADNASRQK